MKKIFFIAILLYSGILFAKEINVKEVAICCPTKSQVSEVAGISGKQALMRYVYNHECTVVSPGDIVNRIDVSFTMVKITNEWGDFWCPREIE